MKISSFSSVAVCVGASFPTAATLTCKDVHHSMMRFRERSRAAAAVDKIKRTYKCYVYRKDLLDRNDYPKNTLWSATIQAYSYKESVFLYSKSIPS